MYRTRREFLTDVGRGMLTAGLGSSLVLDLGLGSVQAEDAPARLTFGKMEPLVALLQETPANKLQSLLVEKMNGGTTLRELVAAAALANARTFGGEDYIGFHTFMALMPAFHMSREMPAERAALPVFKVLYRNATRTQEKGGAKNEVLQPVQAEEKASDALALREAVRNKDMAGAEKTYAGLARGADDALNNLLPTLHDGCEVHRVVLVSRAWDLLELVGKENAHTLLRQSVHYCVKGETPNLKSYYATVRNLIPKLVDQYKLADRKPGNRAVDDAFVDKLSRTLFESTPSKAAETVAGNIAESVPLDAIAEAISLAANQLILRDVGRAAVEGPNKPVGSVHGDSIGVHAADSANAWRNLARVSNARNAIVSLLMGGYQVADDRVNRGGKFLEWQPRPHSDELAKISSTDAKTLLSEAEAAVKERNQARACAVVQKYGDLKHDARAMFNLLLGYAVSEDGALHAEKFYRTTVEEYATTREVFRWRQLVGLARVTASEYGMPAPGYAEACKLLKV